MKWIIRGALWIVVALGSLIVAAYLAAILSLWIRYP